MTVARVLAERIEPAQPAARPGSGTKLWEGRIVGAGWSHLVAVLSVSPVASADPWGGEVWLQLGSDSAEQSTKIYLFEPDPHLVIPWEPAALSDGEIVSVMAEPGQAGVSMWVDGCVLTVADAALNVTGTESASTYVPPVLDGITTEGGVFLTTEDGKRILTEAA